MTFNFDCFGHRGVAQTGSAFAWGAKGHEFKSHRPDSFPMNCTYVLFSPSMGRYYIGQTQNVAQRFKFHSAGSTQATAQATDWQLVFLEHMTTRAAAMALESKIKRSKSKKSIQRYIDNPRNELKCPVPVTDW